MLQASCHCGAVRLEVEEAPAWVNDCNCTICSRYGVLWAYYEPGQARLMEGFDKTDVYVWGDREISFHRCPTCGCVTHWSVIEAPSPIIGVNARTMPTLDPASVTLRRTDNGHTGRFWTRPDEPIRPSRQTT